MVNVEAEVSKYKNTKDRDALGRQIREYKNQALQCAGDIYAAGQYNMIALKLQEIYDKMPAPRLKSIPTASQGAQTKTHTISKNERKKIDAAWDKKTTGKK